MPASTTARKVRVGFIGTGAVTAYHHLPGLRLDPRAELVAICDADPEILKKRQAEWNVEHASTDPEVDLPSGRGRRGRDRDAQRHAPADRRGRGQGRQARHVREAAGLECGGSGRDVRGRARRGRRAHDGVHVSLCAVDALPSALAQVGGAGHAPPFPVAAVSGLAGDKLGLAAIQGAGRRGRPVRHDDPPDRLCDRPAGPDRAGVRGGRAVRQSRPDGRRPSRALRPTSTTGRA